MVVYPERMRENLERSRGVVFSGTVLLELARRGISREQAYEWVQRNAMRAFHEQRDFKALLLADADLMKVLTPAEVEKAFDLDDQLRNVDAIFDRVFKQDGRVAGASVTLGTASVANVKARVFVTLKQSVFDPQGTDDRRRAALDGLRAASATCARASTSSSSSTSRPPSRRARSRRKSPTRCSRIR